MKPRLCFASLFTATLALADEGSERKAVEAVISALNGHGKQTAGLFTGGNSDNPAELAGISALDGMLAESQRPLSEVSAPKLAVRSIRFISPEVAMVDAEKVQFGSMILRRSIPMLFVMRKEGPDWRIASVRVTAPSLSVAVPADERGR
jgi:hypothetical protein